MTLDIKSALNDVQLEAVKHINGPLMIIAGAGSGKTRIITYRIAHMMEQGVSPASILAVTFTNKAAGEMAERVKKLTSASPQISTFHSFGANMLRREIQHLGYQKNFTIYDDVDSRRLVRYCIEELDLSTDIYDPKTVANSISTAKNKLRTPEEYEKSVISNFEKRSARIYGLYQKKLKSNNALDFDDLITLVVKLFQQCPEVLDKYQERYRYILIDEYQDTNSCQYTLIKLLAGKYKNICVVGDPDQSIYQWRGADIKNILSFEKDFPGAQAITMEQNYRSTPAILNVANELIGHNADRKEKNLWTELSKGERPVYFSAASDREEAKYVVLNIRSAMEKSSMHLSDIAIFFRTNAQSRQFEEAFLKYNIPYVIVGNVGFYSRKEIKDILAYLRILTSTDDALALLRIINLPTRGIGNTTIEKLKQHASDKNLSLYKSLEDFENVEGLRPAAKRSIKVFLELLNTLRVEIQQLEPPKFIKRMLDRLNYMSLLDKEHKEVRQEREENIEGLISEIAYQSQEEDFSFVKFLEYTALWSEIDKMDRNQDRASLMTMHNAKGLEFPMVFVTGLEEDLFPHINSKENRSGLEEERRLFYVGITRAKKQLFLTSSARRMKFGQIINSRRSRFLREIPKELLYFQRSDETDDKILPKLGRKAPEKKLSAFREGMRVRHPSFGTGEVLSVQESSNGALLTVRFYNDPTPKTLAARYCDLKKA